MPLPFQQGQPLPQGQGFGGPPPGGLRPGGPGGGGQKPPMGSNITNIMQLAKIFPKLEEAMEQGKIEEARTKANKLEFDAFYKRAKQAYEQVQQQQALQQARNSV